MPRAQAALRMGPGLKAGALAAALILFFVAVDLCFVPAAAASGTPASGKKKAGGKAKAAAKTKADESPQTPQDRLTQQLFDQLAKAWDALYSGKHEEAAKLASPIRSAPQPWAAAEASHCYARALWAHGAASRPQAIAIWTGLQKQASLPAVAARIKVAEALRLAAESKDAQAVATLEAIVQISNPPPGTCTAEAAIELARLYAKASRWDDAIKTLAAAEAHLKQQVRGELPAAAAKPFLEVIDRLDKKFRLDREAGKAEFLRAEDLRKKDKWSEALAAYEVVTKGFPESDYAAPSRFHAGQCLIGLKKGQAALEHWDKFIAEAPAGPWRGQAYNALADLYLEELLDLPPASKYTELGDVSLPGGLKDKLRDCAKSWEQAAPGLHFRRGVVAYLAGQFPAAADSFAKARAASDAKDKDAKSDKEFREGLRKLIDLAKAGRPILPEDVGPRTAAGASPSAALDRPATALALGRLWQLAERPAKAGPLFERILGTPAAPARAGSLAQPARPPMAGASAAQLSYALFGQGLILEDGRKLPEAREAYEKAIKGFVSGTWHDETLFRLAMTIHRHAAASYAPPEPAPGSAGRTGGGGEETPEARKRRETALIAARGAALPYWQEIIKRYPKSPFIIPATYYCGVLEAEAGRWEQAAKTLNQYLTAEPMAWHSGDAYQRLIDIYLERLFDLPSARLAAATAVQWCKQYDPKSPALPAAPAAPTPASNPALGDWRTPPGAEALKHVRYELHLRGGVIAYLDQQYDQAVTLFQAAKPLAPPPGYVVVSGQIPTSMQTIQGLARKRQALTPAEAVAGDGKASLLVRLADLYHACGDYQKSLDLCGLALGGSTPGMSAEQRSWALFRRGRNSYCLPGARQDWQAAKADYLASQRVGPATPWAYQGLFLAGNILFNKEHDPDGAAAAWRELLRRYPKCKEAHRAAYYIGVAYEWSGRPKEARLAYAEFLKQYPDSPFVGLVERHHLAQVAEMEKARPEPARR